MACTKISFLLFLAFIVALGQTKPFSGKPPVLQAMFNTTSRVFLWANETLVQERFLQGFVLGDRTEDLDLPSVASVVADRLSSTQIKPMIEDPIKASFIRNGLPLVFNLTDVVMTSTGPKKPKSTTVVLLLNIYSDKHHIHGFF